MNKNFYLIILFILGGLGLFTACEETEGVDEYANWKERNDAFIDSIARVARNNPEEWKIYKAFNLPPDEEGKEYSGDVSQYIYAYVINEGDGNISPLATDSVRINYRALLINDELIKQSYTLDEPDRNFVVPAKFVVANVSASVDINSSLGLSTAFMHMKQNDRWKVYIPFELTFSGIRSYSNLIVDVDLVEVLLLNHD